MQEAEKREWSFTAKTFQIRITSKSSPTPSRVGKQTLGTCQVTHFTLKSIILLPFFSIWGSAATGNLYSPNPVSGNGRNLGEIAEENNNNNNSQTGSGNSALLRSFRNWLPTFVGGTRNASGPNPNHRYACMQKLPQIGI